MITQRTKLIDVKRIKGTVFKKQTNKQMFNSIKNEEVILVYFSVYYKTSEFMIIQIYFLLNS